MIKTTRPISWLKAARKDFEAFPPTVQLEALRALTVAAAGGKADNTAVTRFGSPMQCKSARILEYFTPFRRKSTQGIKTPKREIDPLHERLKRLKEILK